MTKFYQLAERPQRSDFQALGVQACSWNWRSPFIPGRIGIVAVKTGRTR
ncbi:hypothetical protein LCGC14_2696480, partial [marine sediment metagenome]